MTAKLHLLCLNLNTPKDVNLARFLYGVFCFLSVVSFVVVVVLFGLAGGDGDIAGGA